MMATMIHVWWEFTKIRDYWNNIFYLIHRVTGFSTLMNPTVALLNRPIPNIPKHAQNNNPVNTSGSQIIHSQGLEKNSSVHIINQKKNNMDYDPGKNSKQYPR